MIGVLLAMTNGKFPFRIRNGWLMASFEIDSLASWSGQFGGEDVLRAEIVPALIFFGFWFVFVPEMVPRWGLWKILREEKRDKRSFERIGGKSYADSTQ